MLWLGLPGEGVILNGTHLGIHSIEVNHEIHGTPFMSLEFVIVDSPKVMQALNTMRGKLNGT